MTNQYLRVPFKFKRHLFLLTYKLQWKPRKRERFFKIQIHFLLFKGSLS